MRTHTADWLHSSLNFHYEIVQSATENRHIPKILAMNAFEIVLRTKLSQLKFGIFAMNFNRKMVLLPNVDESINHVCETFGKMIWNEKDFLETNIEYLVMKRSIC